MAEPGQTVTLPCKVPRNISNFAVEITRPPLEPEYVILCRDEKCDPDHQHFSFINRTELKDKQMKDRDASLILKNVTINDTGTYKCYIRTKGKSPEQVSSINLKVQYSGGGAGHTEDGVEMRGHDGLIALVSVIIVLVVFIISVLIFRQLKRYMKKISSPSSPDEAAAIGFVLRVE